MIRVFVCEDSEEEVRVAAQQARVLFCLGYPAVVGPADGYLGKGGGEQELVRAIREVAR